MAEWSNWGLLKSNQNQTGGLTPWTDISNANNYDDFAYAEAIGGQWAGSPGHSTDQAISGNPVIVREEVPTNATCSRIQLRWYFEMVDATAFVVRKLYLDDLLGVNRFFIADIPWNIDGLITSPSYTGTNTDIQNFLTGGLGGAFDSNWHCEHANTDTQTWALRLYYIETRVEFTRAPNVPRTAFIATF